MYHIKQATDKKGIKPIQTSTSNTLNRLSNYVMSMCLIQVYFPIFDQILGQNFEETFYEQSCQKFQIWANFGVKFGVRLRLVTEYFDAKESMSAFREKLRTKERTYRQK